jgi:hypothetical protein
VLGLVLRSREWGLSDSDVSGLLLGASLPKTTSLGVSKRNEDSMDWSLPDLVSLQNYSTSIKS